MKAGYGGIACGPVPFAAPKSVSSAALRLLLISFACLLAACGRSSSPASMARSVQSGEVSAEITDDGILVMRNSLVERRWTLNPFVTQSFTDLRSGKVWTADSPDFALKIGTVDVGSDRFSIASGSMSSIELRFDGSIAVRLTLAPT